jgi:hypothetical protein
MNIVGIPPPHIYSVVEMKIVIMLNHVAHVVNSKIYGIDFLTVLISSNIDGSTEHTLAACGRSRPS